MYTDTTIQKYLGFFTFPMFTNTAFIWKMQLKQQFVQIYYSLTVSYFTIF